jgi:hypothetical protein
MTASPGREVDANLLSGAALGSAQPRPHPQDAGGQNLGDLIEALGRDHEVGVERVTPAPRRQSPGGLTFHTSYLPVPEFRVSGTAAGGEGFQGWTTFWFCVCVADSGFRLRTGR